MKVVALISGGKDSCFNMMQCVAEGHEIVALANLRPCKKDELDSYMYQTVGHQAVDLYASAMQLPLYRREIRGSALDISANYEQTPDDEVEDLYDLLLLIKEEMNIEAVSVGAILSDYQRVRVESICSRLGLSVLAYLWRRDQEELLAEMIACHIEAIVIKVATLGLTPKDHLGKSIKELYPHLLKMSKMYGLNVCGEGGEYETFTLDCPLFVKRIAVDEFETVLHSDDAFAPVAYLNFKRMHLEDKPVVYDLKNHLAELPLKHSRHLVSELFPDGLEDVPCPIQFRSSTSHPMPGRQIECNSSLSTTLCPCLRRSTDGYVWISGLAAVRVDGGTVEDEVRTVLDKLTEILSTVNLVAGDLVAVHLYVSNMQNFAAVNEIYRRYFSSNPPVRVCVEVSLEENVSLVLDCVAYDTSLGQFTRRSMHVQGLSHWAPANIGPYSQAVMVGQRVFVAGQIGLCPATMTMISGGVQMESRLSLRHVDRILKAMDPTVGLSHVTLAICYATDAASTASSSLTELKQFLNFETNDTFTDEPLIACVRVSGLPRHAQVEWHVVAITGEINQTDLVTSSKIEDSFVYKVKARKRRMTGDESFVLPFLISAEQSDGKGMVKEEDISYRACISGMLRQMVELLDRLNCNWEQLHCLRWFYSAQEFTQSDMLNAYLNEFSCIFKCTAEQVATPVAFVPVSGFEAYSPSRVMMMICHS